MNAYATREQHCGHPLDGSIVLVCILHCRGHLIVMSSMHCFESCLSVKTYQDAWTEYFYSSGTKSRTTRCRTCQREKLEILSLYPCICCSAFFRYAYLKKSVEFIRQNCRLVHQMLFIPFQQYFIFYRKTTFVLAW